MKATAFEIPTGPLGALANEAGWEVKEVKEYCESCFHKLWKKVIELDEY